MGDGGVVVGGDSGAPITTQVTYVETQHVHPAGAGGREAAVVLPVWQVPWPRNPNFVGRGEELAGLAKRLAASAAAAVLPQALHGLGGVGKTTPGKFPSRTGVMCVTAVGVAAWAR